MKIVTARKELTTGKRFKLKNELILTDEELCNAVKAFEKEKADHQVKKAKGRKKRNVVQMGSGTDSEQTRKKRYLNSYYKIVLS